MFLKARQGNIKDEYFFERQVGHGGFGVVYKAKNRNTHRTVAIKAIQEHKVTDISNFIREYQLLSTLDHPNVINIYEIWQWKKMLFLVTEYCKGGDLFNYVLERDSLPEKDVKLIMKQCMYTLNYLHSKGICHRDIKLENLVLFNFNDISHIKLIDFGLSKDVQKHANIKSLCSGSPFYIAPEVLAGQINLSSDVWSIAVVMYICLSGKLPFKGSTKEEVFMSILNKELNIYQDPDFVHVSLEAKDLLTKMLVRNPAKRISTSAVLQHPWFNEQSGYATSQNANMNETPKKNLIQAKINNYLKTQVTNKLSEIEVKQLCEAMTDFSKQSNPVLQRISFLHMAHNIEDKHTKELRQLFKKVDTSNNGLITA